MSRKRYMYKCTDCSGISDPVSLMALGGKVREYFRDRDGNALPGVVIVEVLCWWCREKHSPAEVETCMKIPSRQAVTEGVTGSSSNAKAAGLLTQFSELWAFLTGTPSEGGPKRRPGTLSLKYSDGLLGLTLNDAETGQYCHLQGRVLDDMLLEVEQGLSDGSLHWRASTGSARGKR